MDKIVRGSAVGEAHASGYWEPVNTDKLRHARGSHIAVSSLKLENTEPRKAPQHPRDKYVSDTFRSQVFPPRDGGPSPRGDVDSHVVHLTTKFWKSANAMSPAPSPRAGYGTDLWRSKSARTLAKDDSLLSSRAGSQSPKGGGYRNTGARSPGAPPPRLRGSASDAALRGGSPKQSSPWSSRSRGLLSPPDYETEEDPRPPTSRRSPSPTYRNSEDWMAYSSPRGARLEDDDADAFKGPTMPSRNFSARSRIRHSGRQMDDSFRDNVIGEASSAASAITNSVNFASDRGKKVNIVKDQQNAKRRLRLDETQADSYRRPERKHDFSEPAYPRPPPGDITYRPMGVAANIPAGVPADRSAATCASRGSGGRSPRSVVDYQHRTSEEMEASMNQNSHPFGAQQPATVGARQPVRRPVHQILSNAPVAPIQEPTMSAVTVQPRLVQPPVAGVYSYGDYSSLPSTVAKDSAYMQSGLKVVRFGSRSPGAFSPVMPRVPASQIYLA
mmetsp:Transcript_52707/g.97566  ORF Transcript_52707/g.97566 Transcript_52707/m.97566 type:complete len:500 (-) Transcript_52707:182-1681(-)